MELKINNLLILLLLIWPILSSFAAPPKGKPGATLNSIADTLDKQAGENKQLEDTHNKIMKKPDNLFSKNEVKEAVDALKSTGAKEVDFEPLQGFDGINEFEPSGWKIEAIQDNSIKETKGENQAASTWPMGVGIALMNGCFGSNYQVGDPCYDFARTSPRCRKKLEASNFIGVGFDGRGYYSSESRKRSIIQRICAKKKMFMDKALPDCMNAFGIYDYTIRTETFQDASKYIHYLQEKAATSQQQSMFQMEAKSLSQGRSTGGSFGLIGSLVGMAGGAAAGAQAGGTEGAKAGADAGAKLGAAIGQSISFGTGSGSGKSNVKKSGSRKASQEALNSASKNIGSAIHMIAILEADLKLFEVALDEIKPSDFLIDFFSEFLQLPNSYLKNNGAFKYQDFILRWGTHYVKSAKFGGQLKIMKTSKKESLMNSDQFASQAQSEFAGMMGVLKSSYKQKQSGFSFLGIGTKYNKNSQKASNTQSESAKFKASKENAGAQKSTKSEFIKTTVEVKGGDPEIAASITDFYTPMFRQLFVKWCHSIAKFQRPFEFTLGKISSVLNLNPNSLFTGDLPKSACFRTNDIKIDSKTGLSFFEHDETKLDDENNTIILKKRNYCKYGKSKQKFEEDFMQTRLVLERAENIYMTEGPLSTTNFDLPGGISGCESENLEYKKIGDSSIKNWPNLQELKSSIVKIVFSIENDLPGILKHSEFIVKYDDNIWYTKIKGSKFQLRNSCPSSTDPNYICVAEMPLIYEEKTGLLYLNFDLSVDYDESLWLNGPLARVQLLTPLERLSKSIGYVGFVPCSIKWTNNHKVTLQEKGSCIYFQASSEGSIYLVFSGVPDDFESWYYIQMTPEGVIFYRAMKVVKTEKSRLAATLGDASLFSGFFVCITASKNGLRLDYGKAPEESEVGIVLTSYTYQNYVKYNVMYFTFGAGEDKISINDARVVQEKPKIECGEGLELVNGVCEIKCHPQCNGCHAKLNNQKCISCRNKKISLAGTSFVCVEKCPEGFTSKANSCQCLKGGVVDKNSHIYCKACSKGYMAQDGRCKEIDECRSNPCRNGGTCIDLPNKFFCQCPLTHRGTFCHLGLDCLKKPCYNGGKCLQNDENFTCHCENGFYKKLCDKSKNVALNQRVFAISRRDSSNPRNLVDNKYSDYFKSTKCFESLFEKHPWIRIQFGRKIKIGRIRIFNMKDNEGMWSFIFPFRVEIFASGKKAGSCGGLIKRNRYKNKQIKLDVSCGEEGIIGDQIKITVINTFTEIRLCEVQVYLHEQKRKECYKKPKGKDYRGALSVAENGLTCQDWKRSKSKKYNPSKKPNAGLDENYCRNPSEGKRPWCYTKGTSWKYCNIKEC